jgi:hypothetical protein
MKPKHRTNRHHLSMKPKLQTADPHTLLSRSGSDPTEKESGGWDFISMVDTASAAAESPQKT